MILRSAQSGFNHSIASDITPKAEYLNRRDVMHRLALGAGGLALASWASRDAMAAVKGPGQLPALPGVASKVPGAMASDDLTEYKDVTTYNNFYEFGTSKSDPAQNAGRFQPRPWAVTVSGLVNKPGVWDLEDLLKLSPMEERIYRLRCVEGWSMVIPWVGYSLSALLSKVEPKGGAKYVQFITKVDRDTMPGVRSNVLRWPYKEGLRLDEAMHPLTLLAFGMYGEVLPNQSGAPLRLVVPWKYGFKSGKSLVGIRITDKQPATSWNEAAPQEYGFYSNVNPEVSHPRWSQATERRIGEKGGLFARRRKTEMFNGYADQVGQLYAGMDLRKLF